MGALVINEIIRKRCIDFKMFMELEELKHPYSYAGLIRLAILQSCDAGRHQQVSHEGGAVPARLLLLGHQPAVQPPLPLPWPRSPPPLPALALQLPPTPLVCHAPLRLTSAPRQAATAGG